MRLLIDTHCWLWRLSEPERLQATALAILSNPANTVLLSTVCSWEIAIKYSIGRLSLPEPPERFIPSRMARDSIGSLAIQHAHTIKTASLPHHHKDPFDRLLIAQAVVEKIPIMTADPDFRLYEIEIIEG